VKTRTSIHAYDWNQMLIYFHAIVWLTSAIPVILVLLFGHAGYDNNSNNTGGWCWIKSKSNREKFLWEFLGGKFIEWLSCLIVLPFLYTVVGCKLKKVSSNSNSNSNTIGSYDHSSIISRESTLSKMRRVPPLVAITDIISISNKSDHNNNELLMEHKDHQIDDDDNETVLNILYEALSSSSVYDKDERPSPDTMMKDESISVTAYRDDSYNHSILYKDFANFSNPFSQSFMNSHGIFDTLIQHHVHDDNGDDDCIDDDVDVSRAINHEVNSATLSDPTSLISNTSSTYFTRFYSKLAAVPLVFFFIRVWGSLRILLEFIYGGTDHNTDDAGMVHPYSIYVN